MSTVDWKSLAPPHTYLYTGPMSSAGERLNRFALSLKIPSNRTAFLADPQAYVGAYSLTPLEADLVARRDWTGLMQAGGHLQAILKIAATGGDRPGHIGAHRAGMSVYQIQSGCPRRLGGLPTDFP